MNTHRKHHTQCRLGISGSEAHTPKLLLGLLPSCSVTLWHHMHVRMQRLAESCHHMQRGDNAMHIAAPKPLTAVVYGG